MAALQEPYISAAYRIVKEPKKNGPNIFLLFFIAMDDVSQAIAKLKNVPTSPRKMRLIADLIRGKRVNSALNQLKFDSRGPQVSKEAPRGTQEAAQEGRGRPKWIPMDPKLAPKGVLPN